jgi:eukaryotic-like serine/threonine-protein kinase
MTNILSERASRIGEQVGSYRLVRFIGAGGMGEVYEARHSILGTRQAIKFLRRELASRPDLYARFEQEARIASTLENRHIVKVRDHRLSDDGMPYMVMDLADGRSLASVLGERGRLPVTRAVNLVHQACIGLRVAHAANIVHRDLKPENLYVCPQDDGTELLKILDFGIAKHLGAGESGPTTQTGSNLGTAHYMSPEQAQGKRRAIDHRTDIYALGVILYELLSGKKPHDGDSYNEVLIHIVTQRPVSLAALCPSLPRELVNIVHRAMARDPTARFQAAAEFADALGGLRPNGIDSTDFGISLQPATTPRSSALDTLASGSDGGPEALGSETPSLPYVEPVARRAALVPGRNRPWWRSLVLQFCYALLLAAAVTTAGLWLRAPSTDRPASRTGPRTSPRASPSTPDVGTATKTFVPALSAAVLSTNVPEASARPSGRTSAAGRLAGQSRTSRQTPTLPRLQGPQSAASSDASLTPKRPTIDDPLPPTPHAPGIPTLME